MAMIHSVRRVLTIGKEGSLRTHLLNIGHLLSGAAMSNGLALVSVGFAARALTTEMFGVFVLILTAVRLIERIMRFESWQPLIRFAAHLESSSNEQDLPRLYLYGFLLDIAAAVAAALVSIVLAALFGQLFGFGDDAVSLVAICAVGVLFNITGAPTAALRMAGRFRAIAYNQLINPVLRIPLGLLCWWYGLGVAGFLICWTLTQVIGSLVFIYQGFAALRAQGIANPFGQSPRHLARDFPGFISFGWSTNLSMTMRALTQEADTLLVGSLAGASSAGFYHVAKRLAKLAQQVGAQTQAVLYPEMARLWADGKFARLQQLTRRIQFVLATIGSSAVLISALIGEWFVTVAIGDKYSSVGPVLVTQLIAVTFIMNAAPSRSVLLSMGKPHFVLVIATVGAAIFFGSGYLLVLEFGALGASMAQVLSAAFVAAWMEVAWIRGVRSRISATTADEGDRSAMERSAG